MGWDGQRPSTIDDLPTAVVTLTAAEQGPRQTRRQTAAWAVRRASWADYCQGVWARGVKGARRRGSEGGTHGGVKEGDAGQRWALPIPRRRTRARSQERNGGRRSVCPISGEVGLGQIGRRGTLSLPRLCRLVCVGVRRVRGDDDARPASTWPGRKELFVGRLGVTDNKQTAQESN